MTKVTYFCKYISFSFSRDARSSLSAISLNFIKKQGTPSTERSSNTIREQTENLTPKITIFKSSISRITQQKVYVNSTLLIKLIALHIHNTY